MPTKERNYKVEVGEIGKTVSTPLKIFLKSPDSTLLEYLLVMLPKWLDTKEETQCAHIHCTTCNRQCQRIVGHKGQHYYAWGKAGREAMDKEREERFNSRKKQGEK